jgi:predicted enzyme related to lactoylglutathione lyase
MTSGAQTLIFPVKDLESAKTLFTALLGTPPQMDAPYYVQYNVAGQEIGLDPNGASKGLIAPVPYWHVDDINARLAQLVEAGAEPKDAITDFGARLVGSVTDPDGNVIGLIQAV